MMTSHDLSEISRRLHNLAAYGTIAAVDHDRGVVRVNIAGRLTDWLPTPTAIGQNFLAWTPLRVGTQVLVVSPSGNPANGVIVQVLYSANLSAPVQDEHRDQIRWNDGTVIEYDSKKSRLMIDCVGHVEIRGRTVTIHADERLWIDGAGVGYRIKKEGDEVKRKDWLPDILESRVKEKPEIDGDRKTGQRNDP